MHLNCVENSALPPLAWIANVKQDNITVTHGASVECRDNGFVEGAWNGALCDMDFVSSDWFCGTGAVIDVDGVTFSTPSHVTYGIYLQIIEGGYWVSNSLYLLMAELGYKYDSNYIRYEVDFNTILDGINNYKKEIRVIDSNGTATEVHVYYFKHIRIDNDGTYSVSNRPVSEPFVSFSDYYERLTSAMKGMAQNAADPSRIHTYRIVTTISKGYDAPCCAAIAKNVGCDTAITFKPEGKYASDCGTEIAKAMGYKHVFEVDANEYLTRSNMVEIEYICSGELGAQISFCSFDKYATGNMLFTGERGDSIWNRNAHNRNDEYIFEDMLSHLGSCERRLLLDCISVPMPLYGASSWTSIYELSNADEMKAWCMNNSYDRPIPRRIIEEMGVDREAFGMEKHGAGFVYKFDWLSRIVSRMAPNTASSFKKYVDENKKLRIIETIRFMWKLRSTYLRRLGIKVKTLTAKEYCRLANPMAVSLLIPWAGEVMTERYRQILKGK